jgi:hypothetical protein
MPLRCLRPCRFEGEQAETVPNRQTRPPLDLMTIPRHELPGRIVLTIGLATSSLCVVGLIILWLG